MPAGSGNFHFPGSFFTTGGSTKGYKAPELLLNKVALKPKFLRQTQYHTHCLNLALHISFCLFPVGSHTPLRHVGAWQHVGSRSVSGRLHRFTRVKMRDLECCGRFSCVFNLTVPFLVTRCPDNYFQIRPPANKSSKLIH